MKRMRWVWPAILVVSLASGGCAQLREMVGQPSTVSLAPDALPDRPPQAAPAKPPAVVKSAEVLEFLAVFQSLESRAQAEEYRRVIDQFVENDGDVERFRLALVMLMPGKGFSNAHKGREMLRDYLKREEPRDADLEALARLMVDLVNEREKLERRLVQEKEASETLARQLKELRDIENIMRQREINGRPAL